MSNSTNSNTRRDRSAWEQLMAQYEAGDLSQRIFCEQHGLAYSTFGYWRKQLRQSAHNNQPASLIELLWLPKTSYVLTSLTFLPWLSYGPGMRTIALPVLSSLLGLLRSRALLHLEILALRQQLAMINQAPRKRLRFHWGQRLFWV